MPRRKQKIKKADRLDWLIKRTEWALGIPFSDKTWRGHIAERKAMEALTYHQRRRTRFYGDRVIAEIKPTIHFDQDDQEGIDVFVVFEMVNRTKTEIPIQIKNWWTQQTEDKFTRMGICLIIVRPQEDAAQAIKIVLGTINAFLQTRVDVLNLTDEDIKKMAERIMARIWPKYKAIFDDLLRPPWRDKKDVRDLTSFIIRS